MSRRYDIHSAMLVTDLAAARLRETGSRMTAQRRAVLEILSGNKSHPTAEAIVSEVKARLGCVSPATIYNTLEALEGLGFVRRLDGLEHRAHFDPDTSGHQHAICRQCKRVWDVRCSETSSDLPDKFLVKDVIYRGICESCINTQFQGS